MQQSLNGNTLFNTIVMLKQGNPALILVTEGDDDHYILNPHRNDSLTLVVGVGGKGNVLTAAELSEENKVEGVRFIVDSDFDMYQEPPVKHPKNVVASKNHDLIMDMILESPELMHRVISAHARGASRNGIKVDSEVIFKKAMQLALLLAFARITNMRHGMNLKFDKFPFGKLATITPSDLEVATLVVGHSNTKSLPEEIEQLIRATRESLSESGSELVGDHDFFRALARVLKSYSVAVTPQQLESAVVPLLWCAALMKTGVFRTVRVWAEDRGESIFKCPCPNKTTEPLVLT